MDFYDPAIYTTQIIHGAKPVLSSDFKPTIVGLDDIRTVAKRPQYHLSIDEQKAMKRALVKSSTFISKGKLLI
ncbi:MAG: hypothetical protein WAW61_13590 [Methylococcaceae bacterium]